VRVLVLGLLLWSDELCLESWTWGAEAAVGLFSAFLRCSWNVVLGARDVEPKVVN
jgi:hypothetical protein